GEPIAVRTIRLFHDLFPQVLVATNRPERFRGLGVETVADRFPGCGPLAGIHAALLATRHPHVFVAACDMPGLDPDVIRFLLARIGGTDAIVPRWEGDVEPLHAIYAARCLAAMEASLRAGRYALRDFLGTIRVDYVSEAELRRVCGAAASLTNVNTPEELAAVGGRFEEPRGVSRDPGGELVDVLDDAGRPVATVTRREMRARRLPHGSTYVLVFNRRGELFVHLRSPDKDVYPGRWDVAVGGVLAAGEAFDEGARREVPEEPGVELEPEPLLPPCHPAKRLPIRPPAARAAASSAATRRPHDDGHEAACAAGTPRQPGPRRDRPPGARPHARRPRRDASRAPRLHRGAYRHRED